ncbi:response regulator transcription factor [Demequina sp. TTPB684]|uniref:response regulator transcription factor n=1 Tax=unclassified Demequina TaxID=2620311 RepID=UPI001CF0FE31|nr:MULTISPECIES: response regulator transcription factor [unclassified Demequina]MCB2412693.1 response regulator transcription factor [Demequina sp. TTPB684]UPU87667.1 response regulator transcription factor [Demequina sp. TMPB413]
MTPSPGVPLRALVVDDEPALAELVSDYLVRDGFEVERARDGEDALRRARTLDPDVVVLDLGLPGIDGLEVCRQLRTFSDCYVVMLTARAEEVDTLVGLSAGADDYVTKPFSPRELVARVRVMLRRPRANAVALSNQESELLRVGDLAINLDAREVSLAGEPVHLTRTEFDLLAALAVRPTRVLTRSALLEEVWGGGWVGDEHLVDVHILHVRQKLNDSAERQQYVRTVRGIGYRIGTGQ